MYGDEVTDLLRGGQSVGNWQGVAAYAVLEGAAMVRIDSVDDITDSLEKGEKSKRRAATAMNDRSSRAHTLVFFSLRQKNKHSVVQSRLCFADLGGSEQVKISQVEGVHLDEAVQINLGLLALKACISALNDKASHVPYHNSKLTELLRETLGGKSQTTIMLTGSRDDKHGTHTLQTLRFGEACRKLENDVESGATSSMLAQAMKELSDNITETEELIKKKERWETKKIDRVDMDGVEKVSVSVLVGAEAEREKLEYLLQRRRALLGEE